MPERARELVQHHRSAVVALHPTWGAHHADALERQLAGGSLSTFLWDSRDGGAEGMLWYEVEAAGDRIDGAWWEPSSPDVLRSILDDFERERARPTIAVTDVLPYTGLEDQVSYFEPHHFWHRAKVQMRRAFAATRPPPNEPSSIRSLRTTDLAAVVEVYIRAYRHRPGEFWTWADDGPAARREAECEVLGHVTPEGAWTTDFLPEASLVWEEDATVVGAVFVAWRPADVPYVEDLIVDPAYHRRGIGRSLLAAAVARTSVLSTRSIELAAIQYGAPYRLYEQLGFSEVGPPMGQLDGHWIRGPRPF